MIGIYVGEVELGEAMGFRVNEEVNSPSSPFLFLHPQSALNCRLVPQIVNESFLSLP